MACVLVTGAAGLLGAHVAALLSQAHEVVGCDRHPWWGDGPVRMLQRDLLAPDAPAEVVALVKPDIVVHCAAMTDVEACEQDPARAFASNARLSGELARVVPPRCVVLYLSTDSVFSGRAAWAAEEDLPEPATVYARSKLEGERLIAQAAREHVIVRTNLYGWSSGRKPTFAEWLYGAFERREAIRLVTDVWFTPIYVVDLAHRLRRLMEGGARGLVHVAGKDRLSKFEFGMLLAHAAGFSTEAVIPSRLAELGLAAPRPREMSLASRRCEPLTGMAAPRCAAGLERFVRDRARPVSRRVALGEEERVGAAAGAPLAPAA